MEYLESFLVGGFIADVVLATLALEAVAIVVWRRWRGRGPRLVDVAPTLLSGAGLALALRFALTGGGAGPIALCLMLAFAGHITDLARRGPW